MVMLEQLEKLVTKVMLEQMATLDLKVLWELLYVLTW